MHNPNCIEQIIYSNRNTSLCRIIKYKIPTTEGIVNKIATMINQSEIITCDLVIVE